MIFRKRVLIKQTESKNGKAKLSKKVKAVCHKRRTDKSNQTVCKVCMHAYNDHLDIEWVGCDNCHQWFHQNCIPAFHRDTMHIALDEDTEFFCHLCTY
jgi:protein-arginine kinase activator protein McsA